MTTELKLTRGKPWDGTKDWVRCCCPQCGLENNPIECIEPKAGDNIPFRCKRPDCRHVFIVTYKNEVVIGDIIIPGTNLTALIEGIG